MKKIATLTFQNADNYGAMLQCYALQKVLQNIGIQNDVLNYQCEYMSKPYSRAALRRKGVIRFILGIANSIVRMPRKRKFVEFRKHIKMTPKLNADDLIGLEEQYDGFIVGSDQVWNDSITDFDPAYFLDFVQSPEKKLSYGASFGFESIPNDLKIKYKELLKDFSIYNMREATGVQNIESLLNKTANLVLDPTMLLTRDDWDTIACAPTQKDKYILVYNLSPSSFLINTVKKIARSTGYKIVAIPFPVGGFLKAKAELTGGPREWIGLIRDAEIVVTDSFHGSVFSILYNKRLYACVNEAGTRIYNLLNIFGLSDCICTPGTQLELTKKIDYTKANHILTEERKRNLKIIKDMLKK